MFVFNFCKAWRVGSEEFELTLRVVETEAMVGGEAMFADGESVVAGRVSLVFRPIVAGELLMQAEHVLVAVGLGEHRGGGDVGKFSIPLYDALERKAKMALEAVAVDGQEFGRGGEAVGGEVHPLDRGLEDVDLVDAGGRHGLHGPGHGLAFDDRTQEVALSLGELFRVVEQWVVEVGRKDYRGGKDCAGQASAPRLVAPRFAEFVLKDQIQHDRKILEGVVTTPKIRKRIKDRALLGRIIE